jgi:hypothetical protein
LRNRIVSAVVAGALVITGLTACTDSDANVVNENITKEADNFKVNRRTVFMNSITDNVMLLVEGFCSIETDNANRWAVTCKVGDEYKRHFMGKSVNVIMVSEQIDASNVSAKHYKVVYKPSTAIPSVEIR